LPVETAKMLGQILNPALAALLEEAHTFTCGAYLNLAGVSGIGESLGEPAFPPSLARALTKLSDPTCARPLTSAPNALALLFTL
jgi:hypothetical protein